MTENLAISNCILSSGSANAIRLGGGDSRIQDAVFSNLIFRNCVGGIHLQPKYFQNYLG